MLREFCSGPARGPGPTPNPPSEPGPHGAATRLLQRTFLLTAHVVASVPCRINRTLFTLARQGTAFRPRLDSRNQARRLSHPGAPGECWGAADNASRKRLLHASHLSQWPSASCRFAPYGEAIVCDETGLAVFDLIRRHGALASAVHCTFDLLELDGLDLRREPIEKRKALLAKLLKGQQVSIVLNEHYEEDGAAVFRAACELGCEGIVSKRLGSPYRSGRSKHWVKVKNPKAPAVKREAEEDWSR